MWSRLYHNHVIMAFPTYDTVANAWVKSASLLFAQPRWMRGREEPGVTGPPRPAFGPFREDRHMQKSKVGRHRGRRSRSVRLSELATGRGSGRRRRSHRIVGTDRPDGWQDGQESRADGAAAAATAALVGARDIAIG
jgi:hypothetical protein